MRAAPSGLRPFHVAQRKRPAVQGKTSATSASARTAPRSRHSATSAPAPTSSARLSRCTPPTGARPASQVSVCE